MNGYVMFVRGAIPGDRLRVRVTETRARYGRGVIEAIESPSPQRVAAPCPYFGRCGGCRLQHVAYEAQLAFKEKQVRDCLERLGAVPAFELRPILPAPEMFNWEAGYTIPDGRGRLHIEVNPVFRARDLKITLQFQLVARGAPVSKAEKDVFTWFDLGHEWIARAFDELTTEKMHMLWGERK